MPLGGLRTRLLLIVLAPLVPVLVVAFVNARQTREDSLDDVRSNVQSLARVASSWVEQRVETTRQLATGLAREPAVRAGGPRCDRLLAGELRRAPAYQDLLATDARGRITCAARAPARRGLSVARTEWFRDSRATGRPAAAGDFTGPVEPRPALVVAVPIRDRAGRFAGVTAAAIDLRVFNRLTASIDLPRESSLVVIGRGGEILARSPDPERFVGRRLPGAGPARAAARGDRVAELDGLDGRRRIYGFDRVDAGAGDSLTVATGLSRADVGRAADRTLRRTLLVLVLVAIVAVLLAQLVVNAFIARPLLALTSASRRVAAGDLGARSGLPRRSGEVGELAASFDEMVGTMESRQAEIDRSTHERQRLLAELIAAEEEERKRIAEDIHDDSIQALAALLLRLELLESRLEDDDLRRGLGEARQATREAVGRLRHLVFKLSPPALETAGLGSALGGYLQEIGRVWGAETSLESSLESEPSPQPRAMVYRIAVEAVNNAAKHAGGERIEVLLSPADGGVRVRVRDDGSGFDTADAGAVRPGHIGLRSMRERAESAGGWWRVDSAPGRGTTVEFFVPDRGES
jgi:signal transduction histidine kinase